MESNTVFSVLGTIIKFNDVSSNFQVLVCKIQLVLGENSLVLTLGVVNLGSVDDKVGYLKCSEIKTKWFSWHFGKVKTGTVMAEEVVTLR